MPLRVISVANNAIDVDSLFEYCAARRRANPHYVNVDDGLVYESYKIACSHNLRYDRKTNILRDDKIGEWARPSNPAEWEEATLDEAREALMRHIWCKAVRQYNLLTM